MTQTRYYKLIFDGTSKMTEDVPRGATAVLYNDGFDKRAVVFTWEEEDIQDCTHPNLMDLRSAQGREIAIFQFCPDCKYKTTPKIKQLPNPLDTPQDTVVR